MAGEAEIVRGGESLEGGNCLISKALVAEFFIGVGGIGGARETAGAGRRSYPNELLRIRERQRTEEKGVDDAEDDDIGANSDGENSDGDEGKGTVFTQGANGVANILKKIVEFLEGAGFAMNFAGLLRATEMDQRLASGLGGGDAALKVVVDGELQMGGHFGLEAGIERGGADVRKETESELAADHPTGRDEMVWKKFDARGDFF